jgi:hypothetical protein
MQEITLSRRDTAKRFANDPVVVRVNSSERNLNNGQKIVVLEDVPAVVRLFKDNVQIWEGYAKPSNDGSVSVTVGISERMAEKHGLIPAARPRATPTKEALTSPPLSANSAQIKKVMDANAVWVSGNKRIALNCYIFSVLPALLGLIGLGDSSLTWSTICLVIFIACIGVGLYFNSLRPATCSKCGAPTLTRTSYDETFMGVRSVQRIIRNQVTNENEQRTITVSDINVTEKWLCVTCNHTSTHRYAYVSE